MILQTPKGLALTVYNNLLYLDTFTSHKVSFIKRKIHIVFIKASEKVRQGFSSIYFIDEAMQTVSG